MMGYGDDFTEEPIFYDTNFRKKPKKNGREGTIVEVPSFGAAIADSHAHLDMLPAPSLAIARAAAHKVAFIESMIDPLGEGGNSLDMHEVWIDEARQVADEICETSVELPKVRLAIGVHPHCAKDYTQEVEDDLLRDLRNPLVSAVGEIGLDYHYDLSPREDQRRVFARQVELAQMTELPVVLHVREAHDDAYSIMEGIGWPKAGTLLHCYTSDATEIGRWIEAGCYVAFGGAFTFKKLEEVREAAKLVPRDRLLLETDAPFMAPEPFRGTTCEPAHTVFTAQRICEYFGLQDSECISLLQQTYENALVLLNRKPTLWQRGEE